MINEFSSTKVAYCSLAEMEDHLRSFINSFILSHVRDRWQEFLIDKRFEWDTVPRTPRSKKFYHKAGELMRHCAIEPNLCKKLPDNQCSSCCFEATFGNVSGVYFALDVPPRKMSAADAAIKFAEEDRSAMLSFVPGKKALYFCHDGGVWLCEKETTAKISEYRR